MKKNQTKFLKKLLETPSPTGSEVGVASLVRAHLADIADEIQTDTMGSVHAILNGTAKESDRSGSKPSSQVSYSYEIDGSDGSEDTVTGTFEYVNDGAPTVMLAAHMDEIGLMISYISDDGFCSFSSIGGVDAAILPGTRVDVHTEEGMLKGVVGRKPIHLIDSDERKNVTPMDKLVIDLGLTGQQCRRRVRVGDSVTFSTEFEEFGKDMAISRAFDDKSGVFVACEVIERLYESGRAKSTFVAAITTQEEIGTRGAITSAYSVNPDVAIVFDVTHATDYPGIDKQKYGNLECGKGPVIARGPNISPLVFDRLVAAAEALGIEYQLEAEPGVTGTDARSIQVAQGGIPTGLVSIPLRYMHTQSEVISLDDLENAIRLIARFVEDLEEDASFIPGISPEVERPNKPEFKKERDPLKEISSLKKDIKHLRSKLAELEENVYEDDEAEDDDVFGVGAEQASASLDEDAASAEQEAADDGEGTYGNQQMGYASGIASYNQGGYPSQGQGSYQYPSQQMGAMPYGSYPQQGAYGYDPYASSMYQAVSPDGMPPYQTSSFGAIPYGMTGSYQAVADPSSMSQDEDVVYESDEEMESYDYDEDYSDGEEVEYVEEDVTTEEVDASSVPIVTVESTSDE